MEDQGEEGGSGAQPAGDAPRDAGGRGALGGLGAGDAAGDLGGATGAGGFTGAGGATGAGGFTGAGGRVGPSSGDAAGDLGGGSDLGAGGIARNLDRGTVLAERLETAGSLWGKFMGLMGRPSLPPGDGLWLPASNGIHMMFMRFPIDAVFVSKPGADGLRTVKSVHRRLRAWTGLVPLVRGADGVLELPAGTIDATGTAVGDRVEVLEGR